MNLKEWVSTNLMTFSKKRNKDILVNKRLNIKYFTKKGWVDIFNLIHENTNFLPSDRTIQERLYCILNDIKTAPICRNNECANIVKLGCDAAGLKYYLHCSAKCAQTNIETKEKLKHTNLEKLGVEYPLLSEICKNKAKQTNLINYGVENVSCSQLIKDKKRDKSVERYGTNVVLQSSIIKEQIRQTNLLKYGCDNPQKNLIIRNKTIKTRKKQTFDKYKHSSKFENVVFLFDFETFLSNKVLNFLCKTCNNEFFGKIRQGYPPICRHCFPKNVSKSKYEDDICNFIKIFYNGLIETNIKILDGKEIDIFIPELKIGFEFNGIYWHSEINGNKYPNYHLEKSQIAYKYGIKLFHIYEDYWNNYEDIIKSQIKAILKFNKIIQKTENYIIKPIKFQSAINFLEKNAFNYINPDVSIGLYFKNKLVSILILNDELEIQFHNKIFIEFENSEQLLFEFLIKNYNYTALFGYQQIDYNNTNNNVFTTLQFKLIEILPPTYDLIKHETRVDESCITENDKIDKLWNCGKMKYLYINN